MLLASLLASLEYFNLVIPCLKHSLVNLQLKQKFRGTVVELELTVLLSEKGTVQVDVPAQSEADVLTTSTSSHLWCGAL